MTMTEAQVMAKLDELIEGDTGFDSYPHVIATVRLYMAADGCPSPLEGAITACDDLIHDAEMVKKALGTP